MIILAPACSWSKNEIVRESIWLGLHTVDWKQTQTIAHHPNEWEELNPILGKHPSVGQVNSYMLSWMILHPTISFILPEKQRKYWQWVTIGITGGVVANNFIVGIGF
jgi:hypothetical protein